MFGSKARLFLQISCVRVCTYYMCVRGYVPFGAHYACAHNMCAHYTGCPLHLVPIHVCPRVHMCVCVHTCAHYTCAHYMGAHMYTCVYTCAHYTCAHYMGAHMYTCVCVRVCSLHGCTWLRALRCPLHVLPGINATVLHSTQDRTPDL